MLPVDRPRISQFVFFVLGCLMTTAFAPLEWHLLVPILLLPLLYVCLSQSPRDAAKHGFWFGFGMFLTGTHWIYISVVIFGKAPVWIAIFLMLGLVMIMSLWLWLTAWLISRLSAGEPWSLVIAAPSAWVLVEWLRGWVLTGFPWLALGYSKIDSVLAGWAPVLGVYGVSAMMVLSIAAILVAIMTRGWPQLVAVGIVVAPWLVGGILKTVDWTEPDGKAQRVTLIQGGISQDRKWLQEQFYPTLEFYRSHTLSVPESDIVLWPEVAVPSVTEYVEEYIAALEGDARRAGQTILFGILEGRYIRDGSRRLYNSVVAVDGQSRQIYRKRHLVPFGEYFPVPDNVRSWMRMLSLPHDDMLAGEAIQPLIETTNGIELAVMICYEDAYAAEQLYALPKAGLLINVSNDAWFGDSIAPHQHLQIARMRSLEMGRAAIRAANTGISAFIGADGKILESGPQFEPVVLTTDLQPRKGATPYVGGGNLPIVIVCLAIVAVFWLRSRAS